MSTFPVNFDDFTSDEPNDAPPPAEQLPNVGNELPANQQRMRNNLRKVVRRALRACAAPRLLGCLVPTKLQDSQAEDQPAIPTLPDRQATHLPTQPSQLSPMSMPPPASPMSMPPPASTSSPSPLCSPSQPSASLPPSPPTPLSQSCPPCPPSPPSPHVAIEDAFEKERERARERGEIVVVTDKRRRRRKARFVSWLRVRKVEADAPSSDVDPGRKLGEAGRRTQ